MGNTYRSAVAEPPETRTSGRGTPFDVETLRDFVGPTDEQMAVDMQRIIYEGSQTPEELHARARELRD